MIRNCRFLTDRQISRKLDERDAVLQRLIEFHVKNAVDTQALSPLRVSVANAHELESLRSLRDAIRTLPPELLTARDWSNLGDALAAGGLFKDAQETHEVAAQAARDAADRSAEAEAQFKSYRDACETGDRVRALTALNRAVELDRDRYQPFPFARYELVGILGTGAFGTVFHCRDGYDRDDEDRPTEVAIKTLHDADLGRESNKVFAEARALKKLNHPGIIGIRDQDFAVQHTRMRPFFVLEFFAGETLEHYLLKEKALPVNGFLPLAKQIAEAVHVAHQARIFHRDLKPANIMARLLGKGKSADEAWSWDVRVIDFGLAVRISSMRKSHSVPSSLRSTRDKSMAGTIKYAAPEQMGELPGVEVGPYSDVYAFGKTCLELLFQTTEPKSWNWRGLPAESRDSLQELLERCTARELKERHSDFGPVLTTLAQLSRNMLCDANDELQEKGADRDRAENEKAGVDEKLQHQVTDQQNEEVRKPKGKRQRLKKEAEPAPLPERKVALLPAIKRDLLHERKSFLLPKFKPGQTFVLKPLVLPAFEMTFVWIPPGTFQMGGTSNTIEKPVRKVTISKGFYMGVFSVTQGQWETVMGSNPSFFSRSGGGSEKVKGISEADLKLFPVESVSWADAQVFCHELSLLVGKTIRLETEAEWEYRLPSEAEWEYSCRAETMTEYYFDNHITAELANCKLSQLAKLDLQNVLSDHSILVTQPNYDLISPEAEMLGGRTTKVGTYASKCPQSMKPLRHAR